jgi:2'-hydroxyisoflavone reductase
MGQTRRDFLRVSAAAGAFAGIGGIGAIGPRAHASPRSRSGGSASSRSILILGGTRFLGPAVVEAARARGHSITLFNRGKSNPGLFPDLETLLGDRDGNLKALEGRKWDAVVDTSGYVPRIVKASAELLAPNVEQYVFISSISVYPEKGAVGRDESAPVVTLTDETVEDMGKDFGNYGPLKALCEKAAEAALPGRATNIRPGLIVGPRDGSDRYTYWPVRVDRGGEVLAPGDGSDPVQYIDVRDLGEWIVRCIEEKTFGVFNATGPAGRHTMKEMLEACHRACKSDATFTWVDADWLERQHVSAWSDLPVWVPSKDGGEGFATIDCRKAIAAGLAFRDAETIARDTLAWWKSIPEDQRKKAKFAMTPAREANFLDLWHEERGTAAAGGAGPSGAAAEGSG